MGAREAYREIVLENIDYDYLSQQPKMDRERLDENTTYVHNIKKYLLAALYNAPTTISSYYFSLVQHDTVNTRTG
jgi:hypothetical protein